MTSLNARKKILLMLLLRRRRRRISEVQSKSRRKRKAWVRDIFTKRKELGEYHRLFQELKLSDREYFFRLVPSIIL